jgi:hypothetical protein
MTKSRTILHKCLYFFKTNTWRFAPLIEAAEEPGVSAALNPSSPKILVGSRYLGQIYRSSDYNQL